MEAEAALDPFLRVGCPGGEGSSSGLCIEHKNWCEGKGEKKKKRSLDKWENCCVRNQCCIMERSLCPGGWNRKCISAECRMPQWTRKSQCQKHWAEIVYCATPLQSELQQGKILPGAQIHRITEW